MRAGFRRAPLVLAVATLAGPLTSCGLVEGVMGENDSGPQSARVAVLVPGGTAGEAVAAGVVDAVELALKESATDIGDWTVEAEVYEEGADADATRALAEQIVEDDAVAVVGGLSTSAIRAAQPVFEDASVIFVSPADLDLAHTRGADAAAPLRPYTTYYRTSIGPEGALTTLAGYAVDGLGAATVAVIDCGDRDTTQQFVVEARRQGAAVPVVASAGKDGAKVAAAVAAAATARVQAVFVAGGKGRAAMVADELDRVGLEATLLVGPALRTAEFLQRAGVPGEGAVSVEPAAVGSTVDADPGDLRAKLAEQGGAALGPFGAAAYDAGLAVGTVLTNCLPPAASPSGARRGCAGEMIETSFVGVTGEVAFDEFGERVGATSQVMVARDGRWTKVTVS